MPVLTPSDTPIITQRLLVKDYKHSPVDAMVEGSTSLGEAFLSPTNVPQAVTFSLGPDGKTLLFVCEYSNAEPEDKKSYGPGAYAFRLGKHSRKVLALLIQGIDDEVEPGHMVPVPQETLERITEGLEGSQRFVFRHSAAFLNNLLDEHKGRVVELIKSSQQQKSREK